MRILLLKPYNLSDHIQPALGFAYLAAQLRPHHEVTIYDCIKERTKAVDLPDIIRSLNPDLIGIQCYTFDLNNVIRILRSTKENFPHISLVVGGAHISVTKTNGFQDLQPYADYAFCGESEGGFLTLCDQLELGQTQLESIPGLIYFDHQKKIQCNAPEVIEDLDTLGQPAWDLIKPETYPEAQHGAFYQQFPIAPIMTTRGCPYACTFCSAPQISGRRLRHHSVEYIQEQITTLYRRGIREFHIVDDNFTFDLAYAKEVLRGIIDLNLNISLATPNGVRMDKLDDEILELMKEAGLYLLTVAVESGSDRILKKMKKGFTTKTIRRSLSLIKRHGIPVAGFFILGFPGETKADIEETIRFSRQLNLVRANFFTYLPLPGTESFSEITAQGQLKNIDWNNFLFMSAPYTPNGLTRQELLSLKLKAFLLFYINPVILWKNLSAIRSHSHFHYLIRRFYHWILMRPAHLTA